MDYKDLIRTVESTKRLVNDDYFYKYIFKKTERVVSVVFYVLHYVPDNKKTETFIEDIKETGKHVHDQILRALEARQQSAEEEIDGCVLALVALQSKLYIASVTGVITKEVFDTFTAEIDTIFRGLSRYSTKDLNFGDAYLDEKPVRATPRVQSPRQTTRTVTESRASGQAGSGEAGASQVSRRERIRTVLEAKGEASIKDISEIITDCSEKTIQRELNAMIDENVIVRKGERRWSRYTMSA